MPLPDKIAHRVEEALSLNGLLAADLAKEVADHLDAERPIRWNLLLARQLELEKGGVDETNY